MQTPAPSTIEQHFISCLMITLPVAARLNFAKRSIRSYCEQTYPHRELVIVMEGGDQETRAALTQFVLDLQRDDIRIHALQDKATLGALRNISVELAHGAIVCQWDDDDLYHPDRMTLQYAFLVQGGYEAVLIQEVMQYYPQVSRMYLTNWRATEAHGHPGTLMAFKSEALRYPVVGAVARLGEDSTVALQLIARGRVGYLRDEPTAFVYVSHGGNSWDMSHHEMLSRELSVSQALLRRREAQIRAGLAAIDLPADRIEVMGNNGPAFELRPEPLQASTLTSST